MTYIDKNKGVTLIELLFTLIVIAILTFISLPYFSHVFAGLEAKKINSSIRTLISYTKHNAYIKRDRLVICGSTDGVSCTATGWSHTILVFKDSQNKNRLKDSNEEIIHSIHLNLKHGELSWHGARGQNPVFHADSGLPRGGNGHFKYCSMKPNKHFTLIMGDMAHLRHQKLDRC